MPGRKYLRICWILTFRKAFIYFKDKYLEADKTRMQGKLQFYSPAPVSPEFLVNNTGPDLLNLKSEVELKGIHMFS